MNFIDTHAHIYTEKLLKDKEAIIQRANEENVSKILMPNIDLASIPAMLKLLFLNLQTAILPLAKLD